MSATDCNRYGFRAKVGLLGACRVSLPVYADTDFVQGELVISDDEVGSGWQLASLQCCRHPFASVVIIKLECYLMAEAPGLHLAELQLGVQSTGISVVANLAVVSNGSQQWLTVDFGEGTGQGLTTVLVDL